MRRVIDLAAAIALLEKGDLAGAEAMLLDLPPCDPVSDEAADRLELRGRIATARRDRAGGLAALEQALALRVRLHGKKGEHAARGHEAIANHLMSLGEGAAALEHVSRAVAASREPRFLVMRGHCERVAGDMAAAAATFEKALARLEGADRLDALRGLGNVYRMQGNARSARKTYREALELVEDQRSYDAATLISGIGAATADLGDHDRGIERLEKALDIFIEVCGEVHQEVAICLNNLALALGNVDMYRAAAALQYAVAIGDHVCPDHPEQGTALGNLAFYCSELGRPAAAVAYAERGLAIQERVFGATHVDILLGHSNLAHYEKECGRADLALARAVNLAAHADALVAAEQEIAAGVLHSTGQFLLELGGEVERAAELFTASFDMRHRLRRADDEVVLNTARNIGARLFVAGATSEAIAFLEHAITRCAKHREFKQTLRAKLAAVRAGDRDTVVEDTELEDD